MRILVIVLLSALSVTATETEETKAASPEDIAALNSHVDNGRKLLQEYYDQKKEALEKMKVLLVNVKKFRQERLNCQPDIVKFVENPINSFRLIHELSKTNEAINSIISPTSAEILLNLFDMIPSEHYKAVYKEMSSSDQELFLVGKSAFENGNYKGCANVMSHLHDTLVKPENELVSVVLDYAIVCYYKMNDIENALVHAYKLKNIQPEHVKVTLYLNYFERNLTKGRAAFVKFTIGAANLTVDDVIQQAKISFSLLAYDECAMYLESIINSSGLNKNKKIDCLDFLSYSLHKIGRNVEALEYTLEMIRLDPDHARAKSSVLLYEKLLGESAGETTEETSEYTAQFASGNDEILRAKTLYEDGNYETCLKKLKRLLISAKSEDRKIIYTMMSESAYRMGQFSDAHDYVIRLLDEDPNNSWAKAMKEKYAMKLSDDVIGDIGQKILSVAESFIN